MTHFWRDQDLKKIKSKLRANVELKGPRCNMTHNTYIPRGADGKWWLGPRATERPDIYSTLQQLQYNGSLLVEPRANLFI